MKTNQIYSTGCLLGNTPLVELPTHQAARVLLKLEGLNVGGSIKDRIARHVIDVAEKNGTLIPNTNRVILECSGGSMAHGLLTASGGRYRCVFVVPSGYSATKIQLLKARGAEVIVADSRKGNDAHFKKAKELAGANPEWFFVDQLSNPANPEAHYLFTGPEIIEQIGDERIDYFVTGIGSGGTISGVGKRLKEHFSSIRIIGVQPEGCDVLSGVAIPHRIQGWAVGMACPSLNKEIVDEIVDVSYIDAIAQCDSVNVLHGLFLGLSSGANLSAAKKIAADVGPGKTVLTISPDGGVYYGDNYLEYRNYIKNLSY